MFKALVVVLGLIQTTQSKMECSTENGAMSCADKESIFVMHRYATSVSAKCFVSKQETRVVTFTGKTYAAC